MVSFISVMLFYIVLGFVLSFIDIHWLHFAFVVSVEFNLFWLISKCFNWPFTFQFILLFHVSCRAWFHLAVSPFCFLSLLRFRCCFCFVFKLFLAWWDWGFDTLPLVCFGFFRYVRVLTTVAYFLCVFFLLCSVLISMYIVCLHVVIDCFVSFPLFAYDICGSCYS